MKFQMKFLHSPIRDRHFLGLGFVKPRLPRGVVACDLAREIGEDGERRELDDVEPGEVLDPRLGLGFDGVEIE